VPFNVSVSVPTKPDKVPLLAMVAVVVPSYTLSLTTRPVKLSTLAVMAAVLVPVATVTLGKL
jgi:hypothetical protein